MTVYTDYNNESKPLDRALQHFSDDGKTRSITCIYTYQYNDCQKSKY